MADIEWQPLEFELLDADEVEAPPVVRVDSRTSVGTVPLDIEEMTKGEFGATFATQPDADGYILSGYIRNDGFTAVTQLYKHLPEGPYVAKWKGEVPRLNIAEKRVDPNGWPSKADGAGGTIAGTDGIALVTTHTNNPSGTRLMVRWRIKLEGQFKPVQYTIVQGGYQPDPEPCVLPQKLPYLRVNAPITRSQVLLMFFRFAQWVIALLTKKLTPALVIPSVRKFQDVAPPLDGHEPTELYQAAQWGNELGLIKGYPCKEVQQ